MEQLPLHGDADLRLRAADYLRHDNRRDGWTSGRQAAFLIHLADNGVVADAARSVGMSLAGAYALRRQARGYVFNLAWEAALLLARRIVADQLMTAAIRGEEARWVREDGVTTYRRHNTKLALALLDRVTAIDSTNEVLAAAARFDWLIELIDDGASPAQMWQLFFDDVLAHYDTDARHRVRLGLQLSDNCADFDQDAGPEAESYGDCDDEGEPPIEYKSRQQPGQGTVCAAAKPLALCRALPDKAPRAIGAIQHGKVPCPKNSTASSVCRPMSSPKSTACGPRHAPRARTSSTWAWATPICPRRPM